METALVGGRVINKLEDKAYASASLSLVDFLFNRYNRIPQRQPAEYPKDGAGRAGAVPPRLCRNR